MYQLIEAEEAVENIKDGVTVAIGGAGAGHAVPDKILEALGRRFMEMGHPQNLMTIHPCGIGDSDTRGLNHLAHEGLIRLDIGGFWGNAPKMVQLAQTNKIKGYNLPQGVLSQLMRATAAGKPGIVTTVGLHTFVDPRLEGGRINESTKEDIVKVFIWEGEEYLFYKTFPIDVAIIRGTTVDVEGNITMEGEVGSFAMLSMAQAAKINGGIVIAQVKYVSTEHSKPHQVVVPGALVDYVVREPLQDMTFLSSYDLALVDREAAFDLEDLSLTGIKRIVCRRAAMELREGGFTNLGYGISDGVPIVAQQEDIANELVFMIEQGAIAGIPTTDLNFGAMYNPSAIIDDGYQFDFFHGGGLDMAFLGFAQIDRDGNVNSSRFGNVITGCGGSIDISQNAKKVIYCGSFAVKSEQRLVDNKWEILHPGKINKFVNHVDQVSFSGQYALEKGQEVWYITERGVFRLTKKGILLTEVAEGVDLDTDILGMMDFEPVISEHLKIMDPVLFENKLLELKDKFKQHVQENY